MSCESLMLVCKFEAEWSVLLALVMEYVCMCAFFLLSMYSYMYVCMYGAFVSCT